MSSRTTLVLQTSNVVYTVEADEPAGVPELASIPLGSVVNVGGICLTEIDADGKVKAFKMLVASPADVRIVKRPSWLTPQRLLIGLAASCAVLIVIMSWSVIFE